ncbi:hypothetical protein EVAR_66071_1 [Eumeta japonica]|uniref:Uncharacterized protein n=1 Tax=Eumeta variegata TaxID=151549 RepID=A0A4C2A4K7_EUMVA|nr:hypothetical protein EVAR_66071_1 [Eumeta japonica]
MEPHTDGDVEPHDVRHVEAPPPAPRIPDTAAGARVTKWNLLSKLIYARIRFGRNARHCNALWLRNNRRRSRDLSLHSSSLDNDTSSFFLIILMISEHANHRIPPMETRNPKGVNRMDSTREELIAGFLERNRISDGEAYGLIEVYLLDETQQRKQLFHLMCRLKHYIIISRDEGKNANITYTSKEVRGLQKHNTSLELVLKGVDYDAELSLSHDTSFLLWTVILV